LTATKKRKPGASIPEAAVYEIHHGDWAGWTLADLGPRRKIQARSYPHHAWRPAPLRLLTRSYPADDPVWAWLHEHGADRQSPLEKTGSGPSVPHAERARAGRRVELYIPHELVEDLDELRGEVPLATWLRALAERERDRLRPLTGGAIDP